LVKALSLSLSGAMSQTTAKAATKIARRLRALRGARDGWDREDWGETLDKSDDIRTDSPLSS